MKQILFLIFSSLILLSCDNEIKIEIIKMNNIKGEPKFIYFENDKIGYSFNEIQIWSEETEEQLNDPNFLPKPKEYSLVYKTKDGGGNWEKVDSISDYYFYNNAYVENKNIFIQL